MPMSEIVITLFTGLSYKDFKEEYREIIDIIGLEKFKEIMLYFGGIYLCIPKANTLVKNIDFREGGTLLKDNPSISVNELLEEASKEDFAKAYKEMIDIIGLDTFKKVVLYFGGESIYIPKAEKAILNTRNKNIKQEYSQGADIKQLSRKYGISAVMIYKIIKN